MECRKIESNFSATVCECDHLTHFALLLSSVPLNYSSPIVLSLEAITYVGVTLSLVAMAITIVTLTIFRYICYNNYLALRFIRLLKSVKYKRFQIALSFKINEGFCTKQFLVQRTFYTVPNH